MAPIRIDDKTQIPLGIVAALFSAGISFSVMGTWWVASWQSKVNERLSRIEDRLGIALAPSKEHEVSWMSQEMKPDLMGPKKGN